MREFKKKEEVTLLLLPPPPRISCDKAFVVYDADRNQTELQPQFHYNVFNEHFKQLMEKSESSYVEGRPKFLTAPHRSDSEVRAALSAKHVIVRNWPHDPDLKFDSRGARTLVGSVTRQVSLHGLSFISSRTCTPTVVSGTVQDLFDNATDQGKILNGLDFCMWQGSLSPNPYAVDIVAWDIINRIHHADPCTPYPTDDMNWGLMGLENCLTFVHLSFINFFTDISFCLNEVLKSSKYDFEFIVLNPGDMLFMKPNTPHFVFTIENSICYGGHYYMTLSMQLTMQSLIHTFVLNKFLTNTEHQPTHLLLCNIEGLLNLLSVCVLVVLRNVLDFSPDQHCLMDDIDLNDIPKNKREGICYARGWILDCCIVRAPNGNIVPDLPSFYLSQAVNQGLGGAPGCMVQLLRQQVNNHRDTIPSDTLELGEKSQYSITWKEGWEDKWRSSEQDFLEQGKTMFNQKFFAGYDAWCELGATMLLPKLNEAAKGVLLKRNRDVYTPSEQGKSTGKRARKF
ncbi:hypothetical protein CPB84DRAFT_1817024 [Gymnopilus junonius]|uniref:JmjC domain-containing protein n=1 Tax=Gymnopilus junonius TaxID=109634 RepID=A0A9P5TJV1_GYMJU|nr:hypothetical protein CPB84DRAFT_1817024 [Gymnopilus junonius]